MKTGFIEWLLPLLVAIIGLVYAKRSYRISKEKQDSEKKQRKNEIRPNFTINTIAKSIGLIVLQNNGYKAKMLTIESLEENSLNCQHENYPNGVLHLKFNPTFPAIMDKDNFFVSLKFSYEDIDGNIYYQIINSLNNKISISDPIELKKTKKIV